MNKIHNLTFPRQIRRRSARSLIFTLTLLGLIISHWGFNAKVMAQNPRINSMDITRYAQTLLKMEPVRQDAFERIKTAMNGREVPQIVCSQPSSINSLPGEAKKIAVDYCNRSKQIVEQNGLTIERFNQITLEAQSNNELNRQVYNTMLLIQEASKSR